MLPSLQVRVVQASVQDTSMCIFSFEESSFLPGGAAAPERLRFCGWIQVGRRRLRPGGCGCWATTQRGYHCCRSGCEDMLKGHVVFALFRLTPQVVRRAAAVACAARAALGLVAAGPRGVHNLCKTPAVFSLFSCVLYFPRHACSFLVWIGCGCKSCGTRFDCRESSFSFFARSSGHHSVGFCVCFWCSVGFCFVQLCSFSRGPISCAAAWLSASFALRAVCTAVSLILAAESSASSYH